MASALSQAAQNTHVRHTNFDSTQHNRAPGLLGGGVTDSKITRLVIAGILFIAAATVFSLLFAGILGPQFSLAGKICGIIFLGAIPALVGAVFIGKATCFKGDKL